MTVAGIRPSTLSTNVSLVRDSSSLVAAEFLAIVFGLISQVVLTRGLAAEEFGLWIVLLDACLTLFMIIDPGLTTIIGREVQGNLSHSSRLLRSATRIQFLFVALTLPVGLVYFLGFSSSAIIFPATVGCLISLGAVSMVLANIHKSFLRSTGKATWEAILRVSDRALFTLGYIVVHLNGGTVLHYALVMATVPILTLSLFLFLSFRRAKRLSVAGGAPTNGADRYDVKRLLKRAAPFFVFTSLLQVLDRVDKFLLVAFVPLEQIATYGIALIVFFSAMTVPRIIRNLLMPWFSESAGEADRLVPRFLEATRLLLLLTPLGMIAGQVVMMTIPNVIFPETFIFPEGAGFSSESIFRLLLVTWSLNMVLSPSWEIVRTFQPARSINSITAIGVSLTVITGLVAVPRWGVHGAALATIAAPITFLLLSHRQSVDAIRGIHDRRYGIAIGCAILSATTPLLLFMPGMTPLLGVVIMCAAAASLLFVSTSAISRVIAGLGEVSALAEE